MRCVAALAIAVTLTLSGTASAAAPPVPDWSGVNITGARSVQRGLGVAAAYWNVIVPVTVTIIDVSPEYLALAETPAADGDYGRHIGINTTALRGWPAGSTQRKTQLPALLLHEYGHLLGYLDSVVYPADPRHVMFEYSNYFRVPPVGHRLVNERAPPSPVAAAAGWGHDGPRAATPASA